MTRDDLATRVRATISDHLTRYTRPDRPAEVTDESKLLDGGLKLDSLDLVDITMALEDELELEIDDSDVDGLATVGELVEYLAGKLGLVEVAA